MVGQERGGRGDSWEVSWADGVYVGRGRVSYGCDGVSFRHARALYYMAGT